MNKKLIEKHRRNILLTASKVFAEKGYYNTRISDIASELGIGHGTIYRYFNNKQHIFIHLFDLIITGISEIVESENPFTVNTLDEYYDQIARIGWKLVDFFSENRELANIIFYYEAISMGKKSKSIDKKIGEFSSLIEKYGVSYLKNGIEKGFLRKDMPVKETALAVNAMIFEAIRRIFTFTGKERERSAQLWIKTVQGLMIRGMLA